MKFYLSLLLSAFLIVACSKKTEADKSFENLTDKDFILTNSISDPAFPVGNGVYSTDLYHDAYKEPCILDDLRRYKSDGNLVCSNGATKCDSVEPDQYILTWRFIENNSKIEVTQTPYKDTLVILINDGTTFKYRKIKPWTTNGVTTNYTWTETWQKHN